MKNLKLIPLLAILLLGATLFASCSNEGDDLKQDKNQKELKKELPIKGVYFLTHPGSNIYHIFENNTYSLKYGKEIAVQGALVAVYQNNENAMLKIITKTKDNVFYTIYLQNIKKESISINPREYKSEKEAIDASYPDPKEAFNHKTLQGWFTYNKIVSYISEKSKDNMGFYQFDVDKAFIANMGSYGNTSISLDKKFANPKTGQIVYEITEGKGYYSEEKGYFVTIYVKDLAQDGKSIFFAIATKNGGNSISTSNKDKALSKTLEEAKAIKAPADDKLWGKSMFAYAHLWIKMTKK